ncbi:MAG: hypothetical protein AAFN51_02075 [Pseudomonadota bacterium]
MTNRDKTTDISGSVAPEALNDADLDDAQGGVAMLLPAVQAAREAARSEAAVLDFALTGDDDFSRKAKSLNSRS